MRFSFVDRSGRLEQGAGALFHADLRRVEDLADVLPCSTRSTDLEVPAVDVLGVIREINDESWSGSGARSVVLGLPQRKVPASWSSSGAAALRERLTSTTVKELAKGLGWTQIRLREATAADTVDLSVDEVLDIAAALQRRPSSISPVSA